MASDSISLVFRDGLLEIERKAAKLWEDEQVFKAEARKEPGEKFFSTVPMPYMNDYLHMGHAFSLSKADFACAYLRLRGANVLLPFAFHCSGYSIIESADRIRIARENREAGDSPEEMSDSKLPGWELPRLHSPFLREIEEPYYWVEGIPLSAVEDLRQYGLGCDWRRSFVTAVNPFFDAFVSWQMRKLKSMGKIVKGCGEYKIFSPENYAPCLDKDRVTGKGVEPQEYLLIKMEVVKPFPLKLAPLEGKRVFLAAAATVSPMYGQTYVGVSPDGEYGAYEINETDVFILTHRAAFNLAYQNFSKIPREASFLLDLTGNDLIGLPLRSPLAVHTIIFALPSSTILTNKGTGIVTSVPSDAPSDAPDEEIIPLIKKKLTESGEAIIYREPEKMVMSRWGGECVVALTHQWYITYGESEWREMAEKCLKNMNLYSEETRHEFKCTLSRLNQWECSDYLGFGTPIPWDTEVVVESLSDSSLYMAFYTVSHFFNEGDMHRGRKSLLRPQQMNDQVWEYLFCDGQYPNSSDIPSDVLVKMKQEFDYWYPLDLRVSGKDLIQNHLTFFIYNHTALMAEHNWPRAIRCNGHLMLNSEKMSKSTGNFRSLLQTVEEFSATATRFALADAGDGVGDANFLCKTANAAILRLTKELTWMEQVVGAGSSLRKGPPCTYADRVFENEMNIAIRLTENAYESCLFREALKNGFYELQTARDEYRLSCGSGGMNQELILRFIDVHTRLIEPICPQFAEHVWRQVLNKEGSVITAGWPASEEPDLVLKAANKYLQDSIVLMRELLPKQLLTAKKGAQVTEVAERKLKGLIYVKEEFLGWKAHCVEILQRKFDQETRTFGPDSEILEELRKIMHKEDGEAGKLKQIDKRWMPFLKLMKDKAIALGSQALSLRLPFGEKEVLESNKDLIKRQLGLEEVEIHDATDPNAASIAGRHAPLLNQNPPSPGSPTAFFVILP